MKHISALSTAVLFGLTACGGSDAGSAASSTPESSAPAAAPAAAAPAGTLQTPDWYQVDNAAQTVTLDIVAGSTNKGNYWNYNGYTNGEVTVVVPVGYTVTINYSNQDPNMAHSIGVDARTSGFPAAFPADYQPVFEGAISQNPMDMANATLTGESEVVTFVASEAGSYSLACYVPGHAVVGMWIGFEVSGSGEAGVRM